MNTSVTWPGGSVQVVLLHLARWRACSSTTSTSCVSRCSVVQPHPAVGLARARPQLRCSACDNAAFLSAFHLPLASDNFAAYFPRAKPAAALSVADTPLAASCGSCVVGNCPFSKSLPRPLFTLVSSRSPAGQLDTTQAQGAVSLPTCHQLWPLGTTPTARPEQRCLLSGRTGPAGPGED